VKVPKKESKWRIAGAMLAGYAVIGVLAILAEWALGFITPEIYAARQRPDYYFWVIGICDAVFAFIGGYVCAKVARTAFRPATVGLIILGEVVALSSAIQSWYTAPRTYLIGLMILFPALVWVGSQLRVRRVPVKPLMVRV
jgi:hypothetical protein